MNPKQKSLKFDQALKKLTDLVERLEGEDLPLEDSLKAFEEGSELVKICEEKLGEASGRIETIQKSLKVLPPSRGGS